MSVVWFDLDSVGVVDWISFIIIATFAGACMGAVGIGGVVLVPAMIAFLEVDPRVAVVSVIPGYIVTASSGVLAHWKRIKGLQRMAQGISFGSLLGGFIAAFVLGSIPTKILTLVISFFCICFGVKEICKVLLTFFSQIQNSSNKDDEEKEKETEKEEIVIDIATLESSAIHNTDKENGDNKDRGENSFSQCIIQDTGNVILGIVIGLGSALTGTSGPLLFIPIILLFYRNIPAYDSVALSQSVGVPMAIAMTCGTLVEGTRVDFGLSIVVGVITGLFVPVGKIGMKLLSDLIGEKNGNVVCVSAISIVLIATGIFIAVNNL